jgi:hypothetical protein
MDLYSGLRRCGACALALVATAVIPPAALAQPTEPVAHSAGAITTVVLTKLAEGGSNYLISQLNDGLLGEPGKSVGNFLTDVGVYDDSKEQLASISDQLSVIDKGVADLQAQAATANDKIDALGGAVANGFYSTQVSLANPVRAAVLTGQRKLIAIAKATTKERRTELAADFADFYRTRLADRELEFEGYLIGAGPGADGIMQSASKKARAAAQPFFTHEMSMFPRQVASDYALVLSVWLEEKLDYLTYRGATVETRAAAIADTKNDISAMYGALPALTVFRNTVIDTRTGLLWSWLVDGAPCINDKSLKTIAQINTCYYALGPKAALAPFSPISNTSRVALPSVPPTNGSPPGSWRRPTVSELKALDAGATGTPTSWLAARGGFPNMTGEVWTSEVSGDQATTVDQTTGAVSSRPKSEKRYSLLTGDSGVPYFKYWL